ncbi:E3 ubiquitin-protein ligase MBR2 isoform X2 [Benincasa hispida]|uniref:E3 ubiquitin-protein ligase MBR2 isoform X2 n=1 Tax=Benincasa hispida TaxID=102211 RepID=UPI0018FFCB5C|nr:E3 ubiquitin-protein ligase MBR2 isoform X2 [Benincasa hispida]
MPVVTHTSTVGEHMKLRRPKSILNHLNQPISESDPNPSSIPSIIQSTRCKSTISSLLLSTFSNNTTSGGNEALPSSIITNRKKNNFSSATLRGLGCTTAASQQVSVPAVIRTSADWERKKTRKKKQKNSKNKTQQGIVDASHFQPNSNINSASCLDAQDVWCGPGIGFSADAAASVDCVVARRHASGRGKIDLEKITQRERSCLGRRTVNPETLLFLDSDSDLPTARSLELSRSRYYRHVRHPSPDGLAEIMMFQSSLLMGGRFDLHDQFRELRLDVDNMSYEELLELGERIGHVSTGLKEDEIVRCIRKMKPLVVNELATHLLSQMDRKCSICQEDYEPDDEMGKLECGHSYHIHCIKQWLSQKNTCPVCKTAAVGRG